MRSRKTVGRAISWVGAMSTAAHAAFASLGDAAKAILAGAIDTAKLRADMKAEERAILDVAATTGQNPLHMLAIRLWAQGTDRKYV